jgi:hypothetical protein
MTFTPDDAAPRGANVHPLPNVRPAWPPRHAQHAPAPIPFPTREVEARHAARAGAAADRVQRQWRNDLAEASAKALQKGFVQGWAWGAGCGAVGGALLAAVAFFTFGPRQ